MISSAAGRSLAGKGGSVAESNRLPALAGEAGPTALFTGRGRAECFVN
jgi:hypothetical protein